MFNIEIWMFNLGLTYCQLIIFSYVYNCIKTNNWNPKEISSTFLAKLMGGKNQGNISNVLNALCKLGLLTHSGYTSNNCSIYSLTPKVFEISKDIPITVNPEKDYSEEVKQIFDKFHSVLGVDVYPIELVGQYSIPLLEAGQTVEDLCSVIECKAMEWKDDLKMCSFIRPQTLFGNKYDQYLAQSKIMLASTADNNIDLGFIYKVYDHLGMNPPDDLKEWCIKTLKENPDMNVTSLGWTIHSIYMELKRKDEMEWVERKMASTNSLSKSFPANKDTGILFSKMGEDFRNMMV